MDYDFGQETEEPANDNSSHSLFSIRNQECSTSIPLRSEIVSDEKINLIIIWSECLASSTNGRSRVTDLRTAMRMCCVRHVSQSVAVIGGLCHSAISRSRPIFPPRRLDLSPTKKGLIPSANQRLLQAHVDHRTSRIFANSG